MKRGLPVSLWPTRKELAQSLREVADRVEYSDGAELPDVMADAADSLAFIWGFLDYARQAGQKNPTRERR